MFLLISLLFIALIAFIVWYKFFKKNKVQEALDLSKIQAKDRETSHDKVHQFINSKEFNTDNIKKCVGQDGMVNPFDKGIIKAKPILDAWKSRRQVTNDKVPKLKNIRLCPELYYQKRYASRSCNSVDHPPSSFDEQEFNKELDKIKDMIAEKAKDQVKTTSVKEITKAQAKSILKVDKVFP